MEASSTQYNVSPALLKAWLSARSIVRGLPAPIADLGCLRVDTGSPTETQRYVFPGPTSAIRELAGSITAPRIYIKMCGASEQLLALVPSHWQLQPPGYLMNYTGINPSMPTLAAGYRLEVLVEEPITIARIFDVDGSVAASGYAAEYDGIFIFDRIVTEAPHRRRGLGKVLMAALGATKKSTTAPNVLVATEDGRALYTALGWTTLAPYSTVVINA